MSRDRTLIFKEHGGQEIYLQGKFVDLLDELRVYPEIRLYEYYTGQAGVFATDKGYYLYYVKDRKVSNGSVLGSWAVIYLYTSLKDVLWYVDDLFNLEHTEDEWWHQKIIEAGWVDKNYFSPRSGDGI